MADDAISMTLALANTRIPEDSELPEGVSLEDHLAEMTDSDLCAYLLTLRELVKEARAVVQAEGHEDLLDESILRVVLPEDAEWLIATKERDA